jgi:hypothetical protein
MNIYLSILICFCSTIIFAQRKFNYAGHFTDREGRVDLIIKDYVDTFSVDFIKDGGYNFGKAIHDGGVLKGVFINEKDTMPFMILPQEEELIITSDAYHLVLNKADDFEEEAPVYAVEKKAKKALEIPYPTGARAFAANTFFSFNLPNENWDYTDNEGIISLQNEDMKGFFKIIPHDLATIDFIRKNFDLKTIFPGKYEVVSAEFEYGKQGIFKSYEGYDAENKFVKFHVLSLVALHGGGVHIVAGARNAFYNDNYEIWVKSVANSFEFSQE